MELYNMLVFFAYICYNLALGMSLALYAMSEVFTANLVIFVVVCLHFTLGLVSSMRKGLLESIRDRLGVGIDCQHLQVSYVATFRHAVAALGDLLSVFAFACVLVTIFVAESDPPFWYALSISTAIVGNWICNLLHLFPAGF
jgi:hypothetical protein